MTLILLSIIALLCCAILYAHHAHADALEEIRRAFDSLRHEWNEWRAKTGGDPK